MFHNEQLGQSECPYTNVYMVENMAAVKYRRTRKFTCLVLNVLIILYNIIYDKENSKLDERNR